jgi:hypothetical protein
MKNIVLLLLLLNTLFLSAQIAYDSHTIVDSSHSVIGCKDTLLADIDGDGDNDVLASSSEQNKIVLYKNLDGLGNFSDQILISGSAISAAKLEVLDIDGDGDLDLFAVLKLQDQIVWYENTDSQGTFGEANIIPIQTNYPEYIFGNDIDLDGDIDLFFASRTDNKISWLENTDGLGNFSEEHIITNSTLEAMVVTLGDIDNDGDMDVVSGSRGDKKIAWYENLDGFGNFGPQNIISDTYSIIIDIKITDINGDGDNDIVFGTFGPVGGISWYENLDGLGTFGAPIMLGNAALSSLDEIQISDLENDGDIDIVSASYRILFLNNLDGQGTFGNYEEMLGDIGSSTSLFVGDINGDGKKDVLAGYDYGSLVWFENIDGNSFGLRKNITKNVTNPTTSYAVDIDGDMDLDILISSKGDNEILWYENLDGLGNYGEQKEISLEVSAEQIFPVDIDSDDKIDFIAAFGGKIYWFKNINGLGVFSSANVIDEALRDHRWVYAADIDGDGDMDVLSAEPYNDTVNWYKNLDGLGNFGSRQTISSNLDGAGSVVAGDIDGDGDLDVLTSSRFDKTFSWFKNMDGNGTFGSQNIIADDTYGAKTAYLVDLDGDGDNDVLVRYQARVAWFENLDGNGNFSTSKIVDADGDVYYGDVDNDGDNDIIAIGANLTWNENLNGQGDFGPAIILGGLENAGNFINTGDINGDGQLDLLALSSDDNKIFWLENRGAQNSISGIIKLDLNLDGCDPLDIAASNLMVISESGLNTVSTFTREDGSFVNYMNEGEFITRVELSGNNNFTVNPESYETIFVDLGNNEIADFCLTPISIQDDLKITLIAINQPRPGFDAKYQLVYENIGTTVLNSEITLQFDNTRQTYLNSVPNADNVNGNTITWDYTGLLPFQSKTINVNFNTLLPPINNSGDILAFQAIINPISNDTNPEDNTYNLEQIIINSYDPNDKQVNQGEEIYESETANYLDYIVRFQNTGTADAINVRIEDVLSGKLDWNTFRPLSASHEYRVEILNGNDVYFIFDNINLPPEVSDPEGSNGFVAFQIKPIQNIALGDVIENTADIYFDFNAPIITNTVTTTVVENLGVDSFNIDGMVYLYPNPVNSTLQIEVSNTISFEKATVYSTLSKLILETSENQINLESLSAGIYFVEVITDKGSVTKKIVKE